MTNGKKESAKPFDGEVGKEFDQHYSRVRGAVRLLLTHQFLEEGNFLPIGTAEVLDFQGGSGHDTAWLAGLGHNVMLLDESRDMIRKAKSRFTRMSPQVQQRITVCHGGLEKIPEGKQFDLVLSHGVLMYVDDPVEHLRAIGEVLKPNGYLSLLTTGLQGAIFRARREGNQENEHSLQENGTYTNRLGLTAVRAFSPATINNMLTQAGLTMAGWRGVRVLPQTNEDTRPIAEVDIVELEAIVRSEYELGSEAGRREEAQLLHFVAQKQ